MTRQATRARPAQRRRRSGVDIVLGVVGELLFTVGAFIALFLVWQMWYTNFEAADNNRAAAAQLEERFAPTVEKRAEKRTDLPPVADPTDENAGYAKLYVPRWGDDYMVTIAEGLSYKNVLDHGLIGHYPDTAEIGAVGNAGLAAHRMTRGSVFQHVDTLKEGDELIVETAEAWIVYRVTSHEVVLPTQGEVLYPVPHQPEAKPESPLMTLTTCHPLMSTRERYIVYSEFDYWIPRDAGVPDALIGEG